LSFRHREFMREVKKFLFHSRAKVNKEKERTERRSKKRIEKVSKLNCHHKSHKMNKSSSSSSSIRMPREGENQREHSWGKSFQIRTQIIMQIFPLKNAHITLIVLALVAGRQANKRNNHKAKTRKRTKSFLLLVQSHSLLIIMLRRAFLYFRWKISPLAKISGKKFMMISFVVL
jgi:hypothetical protein